MGNKVQTVVKEKYGPQRLEYLSGLSENKVAFTVYGQTVERSYEDRTVFFCMAVSDDERDRAVLSYLNAEDAIELGQALIEHGRKAMLANMINHQHTHHVDQFKRYRDEGRIDEVILTVIDDNPPNYGEGYKMFSVVPIFKPGMTPEYNEGFSYETVIYFSPFEKEYKKQLEFFGENVRFQGYNREKEVNSFYNREEDFWED